MVEQRQERRKPCDADLFVGPSRRPGAATGITEVGQSFSPMELDEDAFDLLEVQIKSNLCNRVLDTLADLEAVLQVELQRFW